VHEGILDAGRPPDRNLNYCQGGDDIPYQSGTSPCDKMGTWARVVLSNYFTISKKDPLLTTIAR
jgi:hypothetical protein